MKILILNGHGIDMRVDNARLLIKDGRFTTKEEPKNYVFLPKRIDVDHIVIYGRHGNVSFDAIRWLIKHNVQISILNWNGKLLTSMLPPESVQVQTKFYQYSAYNDPKVRLYLARKFIEAKFVRTQSVLDWMKSRYPEVDNDFSKEIPLFRKANNIADIMTSEGRVAGHYWSQFSKIIPKKCEFLSRKNIDHPIGASDSINAMLNYCYALLECDCLKAINSAGLDVHVGFLHEKNLGKNSLAYDFQELFRFVVDMTIIALVEKGLLDKSDFIRTENYNLRLRATGAKKIAAEFNDQMNSKVVYEGKTCTWSYVLLLKTRELVKFISGSKKQIDFSTPVVELERIDTEEMRKLILSISISKWSKLGFSKGTLSYMKRNARENKPFSLNAHVKERILSLFVN